MKTTRRIVTMILALALAFVLAVPALAADGDGTIQVTGDGDTVYTVYKLFDTEAVGDKGYKYKLATGWEDFTADAYFSVNDGGYAVWNDNTTSPDEAAAIAQLAKEFMAGKTIAPIGTVSVGNDLENVPEGYYLLVPENGPCGVTMVKANATSVVEEKTEAEGASPLF